MVRDDRGRKQSKGTKVRSDVLTTDPQTNFPIFGAMGFEVTQTLVIGKNTLLVEGPSDILYLQAASAALKAAKRPHLSAHWLSAHLAASTRCCLLCGCSMGTS